MNATLRRWFRVGHIRDDERGFWRYIVGRGYELGLGLRSGFRITGRRYNNRMEWNVALFLFTLHWTAKRNNPPKRKEGLMFGELVYGFYFFDGDLWIGWGDLHCITMPWRVQHYQTWHLNSDGEWQPEPSHRHPGYKGITKHSIDVPFTYTLRSGEVQERIAHLTFNEWRGRPRALRWTSLFERRRAQIRFDFDGEVGEETGSWKGGVLGSSMAWDGKSDPVIAFKNHIATRKF